MNLTYFFTLFTILTTYTSEVAVNNCYSDKGIKLATVTAKVKPINGSKAKKSAIQDHIVFNEFGQPVMIQSSQNGGIMHLSKYEAGKLIYTATTQKVLPNFYNKSELPSLIVNAETKTDTTFVLSHYEDGRPKKVAGIDGSTSFFEYDGCNETQTVIHPNGDTLMQIQNLFENGVLVETNTSPFRQPKFTVTTQYTDYKFNRKGHWVKRSYKTDKAIIIEKRKLIY